MPIMIAVVAVLAGGGYFMFGRSAPKEVKVPEPELGSVMPLGEKEMIVNLTEREYFLRANIAVQLDKNAHIGGGGGDGHGGKAKGPSAEELLLRQVAMERLATVSVRDINTPGFGPKLRQLLASDFNHALHAMHVEEEPEDKSKKKKKKDEEELDEHAHAAPLPRPGDIAKVDLTAVETPGWDSDEGPVLKVYFVEFATMRE